MFKKKVQIENARSKITNLVDEIATQANLSYNRIAIRNQKTRLGSCSIKRNLNFNYQIIKFPDNIIRYVVVHEVCHLVHFNHSKDYWRTVETLDPNYKTHHKWIKTNAHKYLKK